MEKYIFTKTVRDYYKKHRRTFPWRSTRDPYRIFVSEVMLQQTQTHRVLPKYELFIKIFPDFQALAQAPLRNVLAAWQGLGYNRRALMLKKSAEIIQAEYGGKLPEKPEFLEALPGIGPATAASIPAFAFNLPTVFIETNIRTVFIHFFFKNRRTPVSDKEIFPLVEKTVDTKNPRDWYYALMDYGVMLKKTQGNKNVKSAHYTKQIRFEGSNRQIRGALIKLFTKQPRLNSAQIYKAVQKNLATITPVRLHQNLINLCREGFLKKSAQKSPQKPAIFSICLQ